MRVRQYIFVGAVLAVLAAVLVHTLSEERIQVYFDRVEAIPGYKIELREQPLRIAMISVLNHQTTDEYRHALVRSIGRLLYLLRPRRFLPGHDRRREKVRGIESLSYIEKTPHLGNEVRRFCTAGAITMQQVFLSRCVRFSF